MAEDQPSGSTKRSHDDETEETFTIQELIQLNNSEMDEVAAVLGAADENNCSYNKGYMTRQALYACLTCNPDAKNNKSKLAGCCLACSMTCHTDHEFVELYTKRNFRCDCGNKKFPEVPCKLTPEKDDFNEKNQYNQNFYGLYCTCAAPYPNPDDPIEDEMLQCIMCEDWFHTRHLGVPVPPNYSELICINCIRENEFLLHYEGLTLTTVTPANGQEKNVDVVNTSAKENTLDTDEKSESTETDKVKCTKPLVKSDNISAKFMLDDNWRSQLCKCDECIKMYTEKNVLYLIDPEDPVQVYEDQGKARLKQEQEKDDKVLLDQFNAMDRIQQLEFMYRFNDLKEELSNWFKTFFQSKEVLTVNDVQKFFAELREKKSKKPKIEISTNCRY